MKREEWLAWLRSEDPEAVEFRRRHPKLAEGDFRRGHEPRHIVEALVLHEIAGRRRSFP